MGANIDSTNNNGNAPPVFVLNGENYHQIGSLLPKHGDHPRFTQLYIYDTDNELSNCMLSVRMEDDKKSIKKTIIKELRHILYNSNSGYDGRRYNLPTASEVAALVVGDYDAADFERDVVVEEREPSVERLSFHLEGEEPVVFEDHENLEDVIQKPHIRDTKFLAWFEANIKYTEAKDLTYDLIDDDKEFINAINQASIWGTVSYMRSLFVQLLVSNQFSQPEVVWNKTWQNVSDDMLHRQRRAMRVPDLVLDDDQLKSYTLAEIERLLHSHGKSLKEDYPTMPRTDISLIHESCNRLIYDEMNYNQNMLEIEHNQLMSTMTTEQRGVYDKIISRVDANLPDIFFLYSYGGTCKTFIWRALSSAIRSRKEIVLTVASSGIAALLIPGGRTTHSRFGIPIIVNEISTCGIHPKSPLAELFSEWVLGIGGGTVGVANDEDINIEIPEDLFIRSSGDHIAAIVNEIYPSLLDEMHDPSFFQDRAILTPKNSTVEEINEYVMSLIPGEEKTYLSCDSPLSTNSSATRPDDIHTPKFLNTITASSIPNHKIKLKVGVPIMLLRNLDPMAGLCNGTRLIVTKMGRYVLEAKVITGSNIGDIVYMPRLSLTPSDTRIPFKFQHKQFPISVSFAMTINKSQ
ncbi:uncharacterized protein [Medicago truncatula]|uniref:uncharacterized protein n=1 Tax=Medicago truncatula TaxID=3880 RepID=UPI0019684503|nr:uncharacterized protein LOC112420934 [Medicago truncatula]